MARDEHDVVDAAEQPEVAVVVALGAVAGEVHAREPAPVRLAVALRVAPDPAQHRRPRPGEHEVATAGDRTDCAAASSTMSAPMPGSGNVALPGFSVVAPGSGLIMMAPVSVCHHVSTTGHRSPPMCSPVPDPGLGVDRLADGPEQPQRREVVALRVLGAPLHERADRGGRGVEDRDAVPLDDRPEAVLVGEVGRALVHHARRAVRERPVDDVRVAGHPADVGRAPVDVGVGMRGRTRTGACTRPA